MVRMTDSEFQKVIPQFLGITFACVVFGILNTNDNLLYTALVLLVLLILRVHFLYTVGTLIHDSVALLGKWLTALVLGVLYLSLISMYAIMYRRLNRELVATFTFSRTSKSTYQDGVGTYEKKSFDKPW